MLKKTIISLLTCIIILSSCARTPKEISLNDSKERVEQDILKIEQIKKANEGWENNIEIEERDLTLVEFINADLVFATGTNGEITPVTEMEGREIKCDQDFLEKIKNLFEAKLPSLCEPL